MFWKRRICFYIGTSVRNNEKTAYEYLVAEDTVVKQLEAKLTPSGLSKRMLSDGTYEELPQTEGNDPNACAFEKWFREPMKASCRKYVSASIVWHSM